MTAVIVCWVAAVVVWVSACSDRPRSFWVFVRTVIWVENEQGKE